MDKQHMHVSKLSFLRRSLRTVPYLCGLMDMWHGVLLVVLVQQASA